MTLNHQAHNTIRQFNLAQLTFKKDFISVFLLALSLSRSNTLHPVGCMYISLFHFDIKKLNDGLFVMISCLSLMLRFPLLGPNSQFYVSKTAINTPLLTKEIHDMVWRGGERRTIQAGS